MAGCCTTRRPGGVYLKPPWLEESDMQNESPAMLERGAQPAARAGRLASTEKKLSAVAKDSSTSFSSASTIDTAAAAPAAPRAPALLGGFPGSR